MIAPMKAAIRRPSVFVSAPSPKAKPLTAPTLPTPTPTAKPTLQKMAMPAVMKPQQAVMNKAVMPLPKLGWGEAVYKAKAEEKRAAQEQADRDAYWKAQQDRLDSNLANQAANPQDYGTPTPQTEAQAAEGQKDEREEQPSKDDAEALRKEVTQEPTPEDAAPLPPVEPPQDWESDISWQEMQGFAGEDEPMQIFAHVYNGQLCATGLCPTAWGIIPLEYTVPVPMDTPNGPVAAGAEMPETLNETIAHTVSVLEMKAAKDEQALAAESLVLRARAGDQNAMGMIAMIRKNAERGSRKAQRSVKLIADYIRRHPVEQTNPFGKEPSDESNVLFKACVTLANGAPLSNARIQAMAASMGSEDDEKLFLYAVVNYKKPGLIESLTSQFGEWSRKIVELGKNVGLARGIQIVRLPNTPVSGFDAKIGWELGE